ncbi:22975_t:CDS:2 [Dentiscutata erythropus]|uniref:22975_t:CDS:1 n=1 Tax=Dentiscutata erythropus TaxID=1348616 RepID=A0A9N9P6I0_9GLOM|nr:22975_t:CDS:2 [Dentiscutata erythropus]
MSRRYPEECVKCNGFCMYARLEKITTSQPQNMNRHVQPLIFNGPRHSRVYRPEQFPQHPCINRPVQLSQIIEINNVSNKNHIPAEPNPQIQHHQATIRNYQIQPH